ncbi:MAG: universal stress protein [Actinomycetota bacterium]|nr:universal stress protein [Actinomycetota bacterium]
MIEYPKKILLATDGGADSAHAAEVAVALASKEGAQLHLVHVGQAPSQASGVTVEGGALPGEPEGYAELLARKLLEKQVEGVRKAGGDVSGSHLRIGQPAAEVVSLGEEIGADLLVVGSGRPRAMRRAVSGTMRRAALGRVSDYVVRSARCPVLVVHPEGVPEHPVP